jgi:hypothetical protein
MAKGKNDPKTREELERMFQAYLAEQGAVDPMLLTEETVLDDEGGETKWPKKTAPIRESKFKNLGRKGNSLMKEFKKFQRRNPSVGGSGSGTMRNGTPTGVVPINQVSQPDPALLALAGEDAAQESYNYLNEMEALPRFQFDDTYAPDSAGFRDYGGYLGDMGKVALGAFGATKPMSKYTPSADFNNMISESRQRRNMGMDQTTLSTYTNAADRIYNYDVKNIRDAAGGSGGTALANLGGASDRYYQSQDQLAMLNEQVKGQNRGEYYNAALAGESVHRRQFEDDREIEFLNKQSAGALMSDSMDNIAHRKEYEDTYLNPDSPYYQYKKELTLDTRMNRELKTFSEQQRVSALERELADRENQEQDKLESFNRQKFRINENWRNAVTEKGNYPTIESATDFKNYDGQPVVDINQKKEDQFMSDAREKQDFGYTRLEMDKMTDQELSAEGITRTPQEREVTLPSGEKKKVTYYNYGTSQAMDAPVGERTESDIALSNQFDAISQEYSKKKKELLDTWYVKDEKKYNKLLKELEAEEAQKKEAAKTEYLKK